MLSLKWRSITPAPAISHICNSYNLRFKAFSKCWDVKDGSSTRSGPQHRRMFLFGAYHDQKIPRQKGQDRPYCFARVPLQAQIQRLPNSCRKASPRKQNAAHGEASQQMVHQRKKEDPARDHSTGGGDPQKFIRTRVCSSFFSSTSGSGHISSTSYFCNLFFLGSEYFAQMFNWPFDKNGPTKYFGRPSHKKCIFSNLAH